MQIDVTLNSSINWKCYFKQIYFSDQFVKKLIFFHKGAATVRIRHMEVPDAVRAGTEVALNCDYDLQVICCNL